MHKTELIVAAFVAAVAAGLFLRFNHTEGFEQKEVGMPLSGSMGPYDGVGATGWAASEPSPVYSATADMAHLPSQSDKSNELMLMVGNRVDSSCCPAAFNTDTGCVCLTEKDKDMFAHRGGNRT